MAYRWLFARARHVVTTKRHRKLLAEMRRGAMRRVASHRIASHRVASGRAAQQGDKRQINVSSLRAQLR